MENESIETHQEKNYKSNALDECEKLIERMRVKFDPEYNPDIQMRDYTFEEMREAALANRKRNFGKNELRFDK
jgi:hypothetical protein